MVWFAARKRGDGVSTNCKFTTLLTRLSVVRMQTVARISKRLVPEPEADVNKPPLDGGELSSGRVSGPSGAARRLGLPHSTLEFRIKKLGIDKFQFRRTE